MDASSKNRTYRRIQFPRRGSGSGSETLQDLQVLNGAMPTVRPANAEFYAQLCYWPRAGGSISCFWALLAISGLLVLVCGCSSHPAHDGIKVMSYHAWEPGRAKSCLLLNGNNVVAGGKPASD